MFALKTRTAVMIVGGLALAGAAVWYFFLRTGATGLGGFGGGGGGGLSLGGSPPTPTGPYPGLNFPTGTNTGGVTQTSTGLVFKSMTAKTYPVIGAVKVIGPEGTVVNYVVKVPNAPIYTAVAGPTSTAYAAPGTALAVGLAQTGATRYPSQGARFSSAAMSAQIGASQ